MAYFLFKFVVTAFVSSSIISSHLIAESFIRLAKYFPCLQLNVGAF